MKNDSQTSFRDKSDKIRLKRQLISQLSQSHVVATSTREVYR